MIAFILWLRFKQFIRILDEIGFIRVVLILPFIFLIFARLIELMLGITVWDGLGIATFMIGSIHLNRTDKGFLKQTQKQPFIIYCIEYMVLALPFLIWFGWEQAWLTVISLLAIIIGWSFVPWTIRLNATQPFFQYPQFMTIDFEWQIGVRKNILFIVLIYVLALILSYLTAAVLVALLLLGIIVATFYVDYGEEQTWLELYAASPKALMWQKMRRSIGLFLLFTTPLMIAFLIFHFQYWYILLVVVLIACVIQMTSITLKYATYAPKANLQQNGIILGFLLACWLTPFLQPVPLLMSITYYRKALRRLESYF